MLWKIFFHTVENRYVGRVSSLRQHLACLLAAVWSAAAVPAIPAAEVPDLSLEDALARALEHNRDLVKGALDVEGSRLAAERARETVQGIQITPQGAGGEGSDSGHWAGGLRAETTGPYGTRMAAEALVRQLEVTGAPGQRRGEIRMEVTQPFFRNFGPLVRNEPLVAANETLLAARRAWERDRSALAVRVAELYEDLIVLHGQIASDEALAARLEKLWALADARERQGKASRPEVLRMDLQRGEAALRLETERSQLAVRFQEFANLLGMPLDACFRLTPPAALELDVPDADRAVAVAFAERPDYAQALQDIETGDRQLRLARRNLLPDLRLSGSQTTFGEGEDWSEAGRLDQDDWFVGLTADMNLNLRGARLDVARAGVEADARRQVAEIVRNRLALEVNAGLAEYNRARAERELALRNRELAARRAELARALFEAGRASADSVSDAEADLSQTELGELEAQRAASVSAYRLLHVLGTLVPVPRELLRADHGRNPA